MSALTTKPGVVFKAFPVPMLRMLGALEMIAREGRTLVPGMPDELVITSAHDGTHMTGSKHYTNEALDVRTKSFPNLACKQQLVWEIQAKLGPLFTVLFEGAGTQSEHIHVQPKRDA